MFAFIFFIISLVFIRLLYSAVKTREILGRDWGFGSRLYSRDDEPIRYWVLFFAYSVCALWLLVFVAKVLGFWLLK
jgi:hypothetical protein